MKIAGIFMAVGISKSGEIFLSPRGNKKKASNSSVSSSILSWNDRVFGLWMLLYLLDTSTQEWTNQKNFKPETIFSLNGLQFGNEIRIHQSLKNIDQVKHEV